MTRQTGYVQYFALFYLFGYVEMECAYVGILQKRLKNIYLLDFKEIKTALRKRDIANLRG